MPLMNIPPGQPAVLLQVPGRQSMKHEKDARFENYEELEDEFTASDMEVSILTARRASSIKPSLPQRSKKRDTKMLNNITNLSSVKGSEEQVAEKQVESSDPHEQYLSSEEDVSFSDYDDDLDSLIDFESSPETNTDGGSPPGSRGSSRRSQEDTARVVSFVTVGKPQIINIQLSPQKPKARHIDLGISLRPLPLKLHSSASARPLSYMPTPNTLYGSKFHPQFGSTTSLPATDVSVQDSSYLPSNLSSQDSNTTPAFLAADPFPKASPPSSTPTSPTTKTPKTPISMAAAAWKTGISRTLSMARKSSMSSISRAQSSAVGGHKQTLDPHSEDGEERNLHQQRQRSSTTPRMPSGGPMRYDAEVESAVQSHPEIQTRDRTYSLGLYSLGRRKGMRGRDDRYIG